MGTITTRRTKDNAIALVREIAAGKRASAEHEKTQKDRRWQLAEAAGLDTAASIFDDVVTLGDGLPAAASIRFGDAVESDTIANLLTPALGWHVTIETVAHDRHSGKLNDVGRGGLSIQPDEDVGAFSDSLSYDWTDIESVTIH